MLYKWFSICSIHREYNESCNLCSIGSWVFMPVYYVEHIVYKYVPFVWRYFANTPRAQKNFKNKFTDRKTGKKVDPFPNLK